MKPSTAPASFGFAHRPILRRTRKIQGAAANQWASKQYAHQKLGRAVFDAYGWPHDLTDDQILERLLALNLERAQASQE